jgi:ATP-dependent Zn protease
VIRARRTRADAELTRIAHHEAGHAIVASILGRKVGAIAVSAPRPCRSACGLFADPALNHPDRPDDYGAAVRRSVAVMLAGVIAEERYLGFAPMQPPKRCRADVLEATNMACRLQTTDVARAAIIPAAIQRVHRLFDQPKVWRAVRRLAAQLERDRAAGSEQIRELLAA